MKIVVYHLNHALALAQGLASKSEHRFPYTDASCGLSPRHTEAVKALWDAGCYEPVAIVDAGEPMTSAELMGALENAFEKTNHIDQSWNRAGVFGVEPLHGDRNRSTSVGDIMKVVALGNFKFWRVDNIGFKPMADWYTQKEAA